jgi:hypothetical protein
LDKLKGWGKVMIDEWGDRIGENRRPSHWVIVAFAILAIISLGALGIAWHNSTELQRAKQSFSWQLENAEQGDREWVAELEQQLIQANAASMGFGSDLVNIEKRLRLTESNLKKASGSGARIRQEDAQRLDQMDLEMKTQLATKASTEDLKAVNGNVSKVKTDLESTKSDLKTSRSELGTLIARNHEEIEALRRLGQKDYVEFNIQSKNNPQIIGNIIVELRSVNIKKNTFTLVLTVDDVSTEKKNRTVNEPIIVYLHGSRQADEFVVNSVAKDKIEGYLSMPNNPPATTAGVGSVFFLQCPDACERQGDFKEPSGGAPRFRRRDGRRGERD